MHDIRSIRNDPEAFDAQMQRRNPNIETIASIAYDANRLAGLENDLQEFRSKKNTLAAAIGRAKQTGEPCDDLLESATRLSDTIASYEKLAAVYGDIPDRLAHYPNILLPEVPSGADEADNVEIYSRPGVVLGLDDDSAPFREHFDIAGPLGLDAESGVMLAPGRFTVLKSGIAAMARALGQFMLDTHTGPYNGYTEVNCPVIVRGAMLYGTGQFPKFADDVYQVGEDAYLAPTSEVMLTNLVRDRIIPYDEAPIRMVALTPCFRKEAGSAGRDTRGLIRQNQFDKVELVSVVHPDDEADEHERMTRCAEGILEKLGLPYRRMLLCSGDTGFSASKTYDLEVWMAGAQRWREISSCSRCGDFQSRRMNTRIKRGKEKVLASTLNGSGVAIGRALAAIIEYYQEGDNVIVPEALRLYMGDRILV